MLAFENPGSVDRVCDVVRAMLTAYSMAQVIQLAAAFLEDSRIAVVRIKDRFVADPTRSGWRDLVSEWEGACSQ